MRSPFNILLDSYAKECNSLFYFLRSLLDLPFPTDDEEGNVASLDQTKRKCKSCELTYLRS